MRLGRCRLAGDGSIWVAAMDPDGTWAPLVAERDEAHGQSELLRTAGMRQRPQPQEMGQRAQALAPIPRPPSIRDCYAFEAHVATARAGRGLEMDADWYQQPVFYFSNPASIIGPDAPVWAPTRSQALDYELEVAAVIGTDCADVAARDWLDVVAGFTVLNDWSARDLQAREMRQSLGPAKGKDFAISIGPVLVTPDELPGVDTGRPSGVMVARVDGTEWSRGQLGDIHFTWGQLIEHVSRDARLRAGDLIGSGTVGTGCILELSATHGADAYPYLQPGQEVACEVEGIGTLANPIVAHP